MKTPRAVRSVASFWKHPWPAIAVVTAIAVVLGMRLSTQGTVQARSASVGPHIYLQESHEVATTYQGSQHVKDALALGGAEAISLASGDFDQDGVADLLVGYGTPQGGILALHRGNLDAFAPQSSESFRAIAEGRFPSPFLPSARAFPLVSRPDFLATGHFTDGEHLDFVVATRGSNQLHLYAGNGKGQFSSPATVVLPGAVTAIGAGKLGPAIQFNRLLVGVEAAGGSSSLIVFTGSVNGLSKVASHSLDAPASAIEFGNLDADGLSDAAIVSGGNVMVLHGDNNIAGKLETLSLPLSAGSIALGRFVHDRDPRLQISVLSPDGTVHIVAHNGFDPRAWTAEELKQLRQSTLRGRPNFLRTASLDNGWKIVESFAGVAPFTGSNLPLIVRGRISSKAADDVMVLNPDGGQMTVLSHPNAPVGAVSLAPGQPSTRAYASGMPVAALSMRVNIDGRPGMVVLHQGQVAPSVMMPLPDPTFTVNTTSDTVDANPGDGICADSLGHCSLRAAVMEANATLGVDTIMVPAGTYTLTIPGIDEDAAATGDLDITDGVNIIGAGASTTIIQAGTTAANGIDKVFSINPNGLSSSFDTSLSNLTIRFGRNTSAISPFGGAFDWDAGTSGTGNLTVTNCVISNNSTVIVAGGLTSSDGGGFFASNAVGNTGTVSVSGTVIQNNSAADDGGGVEVGANIPFTLTNSQVLSNSAVGGGDQNGGGLFIFGPSGASQSAIHNSSISSNHAGNNGGGIYTTAGILVDQGSILSSNQAGGNGGGLWDNAGETLTLSRITITSNTATGSGGGIQVDNNNVANNLNVTFTRIAGNTAATGSGINNVAGTVSAIDNWWGCTQGPGLSPCDRVAGTVTFTPWITLGDTSSPTAINVGDASTLTASLLQDSNGAAIPAANLSAFVGVPVTFNNAINGTLANCQATIQSSITATCSFTGSTAGTGQADAHVDQATATATLAVKDFTIGVTPASQTVSVGSGTTYTVTVSPVNGFSSSVCLSVNNALPTGVTASFSPSCIAGGSGTSTLTVNTSSAAVAGNPAITVKGTAGNDNHLASPVTLKITDFTIAVAPSSQTINVTSPTSYTVTIAPVNGFTGSVCLSLVAPPTGVSGTFTPSCVTGGSGNSTLNITTTNSAVGGNYSLTVKGLSGNDPHTTSPGLVLRDFSLGVSPSTQPVNAGTCVNYTVTVTSIQGFTGSVVLSLNSPPAGITATFTPGTVTGAGTSTMNVCASTSAAAQADALTVNGTSGAITRNTSSVTLNVRDFTISVSPASQTVTAGHGTTYTVTVSPLNGFNSSVCLSFTNPLPTGISGSFSPACIPGGSGSSTLTVNTLGSVATSAYTIPVTGNASPPAHNLSVTLNVSGTVTLRPTTATANGVAYSNPANAEDGNLSTFASGTVAASMSGEIWGGFGSVSFTPSAVTLKISSAANCGDAFNDGIELAYSLDGGNTYNFGYIMGLFGGSCVNRPQQTDVISLPTNQNLANVKVLAIFYSPAGTSSHQVFDAWIEVTP